jgi:transposase
MRVAMNAILYLLRTGRPWRYLRHRRCQPPTDIMVNIRLDDHVTHPRMVADAPAPFGLTNFDSQISKLKPLARSLESMMNFLYISVCHFVLANFADTGPAPVAATPD